MSERIACGDKIGIFRRTEEMVHQLSGCVGHIHS